MFPAQAVDKVAVDGSQRQPPLLRQGSGFGAVLQNPCHFRRREIRRKRQTCFLLHHVGVVGQRIADFLGAGALPDNSLSHGGAVGLIPSGDRLALVADAERGNLHRVNSCFLHHVAANCQHIRINFIQIVADPAALVHILPVRAVSAGRQAARRIKQHRFRALGALVDG